MCPVTVWPGRGGPDPFPSPVQRRRAEKPPLCHTGTGMAPTTWRGPAEHSTPSGAGALHAHTRRPEPSAPRAVSSPQLQPLPLGPLRLLPSSRKRQPPLALPSPTPHPASPWVWFPPQVAPWGPASPSRLPVPASHCLSPGGCAISQHPLLPGPPLPLSLFNSSGPLGLAPYQRCVCPVFVFGK